ncbi:MAG: thiamine pyrophosphate-requiring protein [Rhodospirillaceae bacterium]|jgi:acetolactate synthase I/II/III large subunit|nr:thiamine pyrophosphate-requiring protein [Rhodospirillaceae bacterium]MBT5195660.1 thiamine pyrophosphate-requiring protein [Rhodospirillaceae bacterium]MBT5896170.1 thiamine pyrophosphate-requiring protein [Rhodospirillaceae bacterium]MBT6426761.1 thiamine pyrophosphate-requiring protein [Rhodospirillaceae bacterium]MBT7755937.1 thiamine pyrophosphate-requiring protein [Rhodospirillaceae bacterium]
MNGIDYITQILKQEGIEWLSCFPSNPLISAAAREGIRPIAFRHERGAVMAADGYSRVSDRQRFGVVAVQAQAGAENVMGGLSQAYADNIPILVMLGGNNLNQISVRPNFSAVQKYQGWCKQVEAIYTPDQVGDVMRRAFHALRNGTPGPVVVELTGDVCAKEVPEEAQNYKSPSLSRQSPEAGDIEAAAKALIAAKKPLIWAGAGVLFAGATEALRELAELTATPVFTTMPGKSALDERHPLALGAGSGATTLPAHRWLTDSDVLLALGSSLTRSPYGQPVRPGKLLIHNSVNPDDINKDEAADIGLIGDTQLTIQALIEEIKAQTNGKGCGDRSAIEAEVAAIKSEWMEEWTPVLQADDEPLTYYRVIHELNQNLDLENSIVTHDAGAPRDSIVPFFHATTPHSFIGWGKTTHLGFGIPLMIGAKMAEPDKFCLNLMGDGAFGMSGTDIETAVRSKAAITTVLLNNSAMATYTGPTQGNIGPEARERYGVSTMHGNYANIAEGMGAVGIEVTKVSEMAPALQEAQRLNAAGQTVLIDVHANVEERRSRF